jgi:hypothetical protein
VLRDVAIKAPHLVVVAYAARESLDGHASTVVGERPNGRDATSRDRQSRPEVALAGVAAPKLNGVVTRPVIREGIEGLD